MKISIKKNGTVFEADLDNPMDISMPLRFNGPQPNAYGVEPARSMPVEAGDLVGDTRRGGSVNFEQYTFIPHCNGTHTECVGHITDERISVSDCLQDVFMTASLVSVQAETREIDSVISRESLESSLQAVRSNDRVELLATAGGTDALIVRTLPNDDRKLTASYGEGNIPPFFTADAMEYIVERGFKHLLVDMPSIDRIFDEGKLANHRIFWNVERESREISPETRIRSTITELIYVPNEVAEGEYLLNLQIAPFDSDCAPSRPIMFLIT